MTDIILFSIDIYLTILILCPIMWIYWKWKCLMTHALNLFPPLVPAHLPQGSSRGAGGGEWPDGPGQAV